MTLREARCRYTAALGQLIGRAVASGYEIAIDEATERLTAKDPTSDHMKGSLHHIGLAADFNLYRGGSYLANTEDHKPLGEWWEKLGTELGLPLRWGGRFKDGNHYSLEWEGKK